jgi:hypothetical protein
MMWFSFSCNSRCTSEDANAGEPEKGHIKWRRELRHRHGSNTTSVQAGEDFFGGDLGTFFAPFSLMPQRDRGDTVDEGHESRRNEGEEFLNPRRSLPIFRVPPNEEADRLKGMLSDSREPLSGNEAARQERGFISFEVINDRVDKLPREFGHGCSHGGWHEGRGQKKESKRHVND